MSYFERNCDMKTLIRHFLKFYKIGAKLKKGNFLLELLTVRYGNSTSE